MRNLIAAILISVFCAEAKAATNVAASCSYSDVTNAIARASDGDTVIIPSGDCIWTNGLSTTKAIKLIGAGQALTIIRDQIPSSSASLFQIYNTHKKFVRISGMTIVAGTNSYAAVAIGSITTTNRARVDHLTITNLVRRGIQMLGWSLSCIDHCSLYTHPSVGAPTGIDVTGFGNLNISQYGGATNSNPSWDTIPFELGTTNMVVIEDNLFVWTPNTGGANGVIDAYNGARFCFRYNTITNSNVGAHGTDSGGTMRSAHTFEVYKNVSYISPQNALIAYSFRGGTGIFWSNTVVSANAFSLNGIRIDSYRNSGTNIYGGVTPCCLPYGPISATNIYGGRQDSYGYPAYDQIGRTSPTIYNTTNTVQTLQPLYQWSNTFNGVLGMKFVNWTVVTNAPPYDYIPPSNLIIQENRDYYNDVPPTGYTPLRYPHPLTLPVPEAPTNLRRLP